MSLKRFWKEAKHVLAFVLAIALFFNGWANYDFSVLAAELAVTLDNPSTVYTGLDITLPTPGVAKDGTPVNLDADNVTVVWTDESGQTVDATTVVNAGTYTVTVTVTEQEVDADGNPVGDPTPVSDNAQFTVQPLNLDSCTVTVNGSYTYTGAPIEPTKDNLTVTSSGGPVAADLYTIKEYANNTEAGTNTASVTVKAADGNTNVTGEATGTFKIEPVVFDVVWSDETYTYDGMTVHFPTATVGGVAVEKCDEAIKITNDVSVTLTTDATVNSTEDSQKYTARLTLSDTTGNYKLADGKESLSYTVEKKEITEADVTISPEKGTANAANHTSTVSVVVDGKTLAVDTDYTVTKPVEMILGGKNYEIVVIGMGNYKGEVRKEFVLSYAEDTNANVTVSGSTYKNSVYTGTVTVTPADGYMVSESEIDGYADSLAYDATSTKPAKLYLKNNSTGFISEVDFPSFTFDNSVPALTVTEPDNNSIWANSKEIGISADGTGTGVEVYYTTGSKVELTSPVTQATDLSGLEELDGNLKISENLHSDRTYYFYAIDEAGNVAVSDVVVVNKVDVDAPTVSVDPDKTVSTIKNGVYWKNADDMKIPIKVEDATPGIKKIDVTGTTNPFNVTEGATEASAELTVTGKGEYTISATDVAGNTTDPVITITVGQDSKAPAVTSVVPTENDAGKDANGVYWFADTNVELALTIEDEVGDNETEKSPYDVFYTTDDTIWEKVTVAAGKATVSIKEAGKAVTYKFKAVDVAGNESATVEVKLGYDNTPAEVTAAELTQLNTLKVDKWINKAEFGGVSKVSFSVTANDAESGIKKIEYSSDNGATYKEAAYTEANGVYTFVTDEAVNDGTKYQWKIVVTNNVGIASEAKEFKDAEGNHLGQIDTEAPSTTAYIKFLSDTEGANDTNRGSVNEDKTDGKRKWSSNIYEMAKAGWNKIWGKTTVKFEVYVQDVTSGIDSITMSYNGTAIPAEDLKLVPGLKAFTEGAANTTDADSNATGYTVFEGTITYSGDEGLAVRNFQIESLTDAAGNTVDSKVILNTKENEDIIYLDNVAPKLVSIEIDDQSVTAEERYLYNDAKTVTLEIEERFFAEKDFPKVIVQNIQDKSEVSSTQDWKLNKENGLWQVNVPLPKVDGEAKEYQIIMNAYEDPSGNSLTGIAGVAADGSFASKTLVVDNKPPKLVNYSVNDSTGCILDNAAVYKNDSVNDDLRVEFEIDEHATDYEKAKDNLIINVYDAETQAVVRTLTEADDALVKDYAGRSHKYSFTFDGDANVANKYYVEVTYADAVGNPLENETALAAAENKKGTYQSDKYIIDHTAPVLNVEYTTAATRIVKDGKDGEGTKPLADYTAYYNTDIGVKLTFDEKYVHSTEENAPLEHFEITVKKDGNVIAAPEITWTHDGTKHTAIFTITTEEDHSTDGNYQFDVNYRDCAENLMVAKENTDTVNLLEDGVYTSPMLVLDTDAPKVKTEYSEAAVCTVDGRDYFNHTDATFDITVKDRNIRYSELKTELSEMEAYDVDGTVISDTALETAINAIAAETVHADGNSWTLKLPLSTEANYDIPVYFTDLAGNAAVVNGAEEVYTEAVTVDKTAVNEEIYIDFNCDVTGANDLSSEQPEEPWYRGILEFISDQWNKIWGRTNIDFKVYVRDEISGVESLTMSYFAETETIKMSSNPEEQDMLKLEKLTDLEELNGAKYVVYSGSLTLEEGNPDLAISQFQIIEAKDKATNARGPLWFAGTETNAQIYLDNTAPVLASVTIDNVPVVEETRYFYGNTTEVVLTINERFFAQEDAPVYPEVTLWSRDGEAVKDSDSFNVVSTTQDWEKAADGVWKLTVPLEAKEDDGEIEYKLTMDAYRDPAANLLTGTENGVKEDGSFESKIFVIDTLAPKITSYEVERTTGCDVDGAEVRKNDAANHDLTVKFKIDDNATYYHLSRGNLAVNVYMDDETDPRLTLMDVNELPEGVAALTLEKTDDRIHEYSFTYDGEDAEEFITENKFHVEISYRDIVNNALINNDVDLTEKENTDDNDTYKSGQYIIDHVDPVFNIEYSDATNVVENGVSHKDNKPLSNHTAYYNKDIKVTLTFDEKYVNTDAADGNVLEHFVFTIEKDGTALTGNDVPEITWKHEGTLHTATFTIKAAKDHSTDGNYKFVVEYRDCAENAMAGDTEANADLENLMSTEGITGVYTSPVLVIDTTAPIVTTKYMNGEAEVNPNQTAYGRDYFNDLNTVFRITVDDRNIRYGELKSVLSDMAAYDISKAVISNSALEKAIAGIKDTDIQCVAGNEESAKNLWTLNLPLTTEANYDIPVNFTDLAGNPAVVNGSVGTFTEYVTTDSTIPGFDLSYSIEDPANYLEWGYLFAKKKMTVTVTATDATAGVQTIKFTIVDENGKETVKTQKFEPSKEVDYSVSIPLQTNDFKGSIFAEVFDYATNTDSQKRGHIVESTSKHSSTGTAKITTITSPSRTVNGIDFYNTDVKFKLLLEDTYSGLGSWEYVGGYTLKDEAHYKSDAGTDLSKDPTMKIVSKLERTLTLDAAKNNENDILVKANFVDNAGHELSVEEEYNIDITKPIITVEYDLNEPANGKYYKETRTATVKIRERNFDPADVEFLITSTDGPKPEISGWSEAGTGDNTIHTCTVAFSRDSDYTFTVKFMDMAGNTADYDRVDEFTIDKTIPVATVTYDNNSYLNEYYYNASRTATIDILEHNFDPSAIEIMVTADGSTAGVPHISAWASNGDHNIATITFSADAEYTFDIAGMDLALNELEDYTPDHFVVDQTAPELEIFDIEHMSANNGVVRPGIRYYDTNYDKDGTVILMTGYHNGVVEMTGARKLEANGLELKLDDFAYVQEMDDLYTMEATVYDLAGNSSEAMVMFSVNRFGSVYTFDKATDALIGDNGKYYTNKEQELVITETNVDTLEFKEITMNLNGKLTTLKEGVDYTVRLEGNDATWKQYTYTLKAENFVEEGTYILTIYSEDRATNTSDNNTKGKKIEFVVDKTNPSALISGVENGGQYRVNSKEMTIDIEDNVRLSQVVVTIDGVETVYDAAQINEMDGKLVLNIGSANHWQDVKVVVTDAAGNEEISEEMRVLVTANIFVQFFMNKPVFYGTLGGGAVLAALLWWFLVGKKKKKEEEQAQ